MSGWIVSVAADGREYYQNTITKQTTWTKPAELKTALEKDIEHIGWKEIDNPDGSKYYFNSKTNVTSMEMPQDYKLVLDKHAEKQEETSKQLILTGASAGSMDLVLRTAVASAASMTSDYMWTPAEAEQAFKDLLEDLNVDHTWKWDDVLRSTIDKPEYKALKSMSDRKLVLSRYLQEKKQNEKEQLRLKYERDRKVLKALFDRVAHPNGRFIKVASKLANDTAFNRTNPSDRELIYNEWTVEKRKLEKEAEKQRKALLSERFRLLLQTMHLQIDTKWSDIKDKLQYRDIFIEMFDLDPLQVLLVFESEMRAVEDLYYNEKRRNKTLKYRNERKNRQEFRELISPLVRFDSKFKYIFPKIKDDERFLNMLGQSGSTPLELFRDLLIERQQEYSNFKKRVSEIADHVIQITSTTEYSEFKSAIEANWISDEDGAIDEGPINLELLREVFEDLQYRFRHKEKKIRRLQDDFRYAIKKLEPPVEIGESLESVEKRLDQEFALSAQEKLEAFEKYMKKLLKRKRDSDDEVQVEHRKESKFNF